MAKQTGLGDNLYIHGYDLSGDTNAISALHSASNLLDATGIDKSAMERMYGLADGEIAFTTFFNDTDSFLILKPNYRTRGEDGVGNQIVQYFHGTTVGNQAAAMKAKQVTHDPNRAADGSLIIGVQALAAVGHPLEWTEQLTAGRRTDTVATNGASIDFGSVSTVFGMSAYLNVFAFTGTSVTVTVQDSADNITFANITGGSFTAVTAAPDEERIVTASGATIRRYVRVVTTGTFSNVNFAVSFRRYSAASEYMA